MLTQDIEVEIKNWQTVVGALDWVLRKNPHGPASDDLQIELNAAIATVEELKAQLRAMSPSE